MVEGRLVGREHMFGGVEDHFEVTRDGELIHQVTCAVESMGVSGEVHCAKQPYKLRRTCRPEKTLT
jgi:hypothetical protein